MLACNMETFRAAGYAFVRTPSDTNDVGFPQSNFLGSSSICWDNAVKYAHEALMAGAVVAPSARGVALQANAMDQDLSSNRIVSTDPPYYDNVGYADLSDFFYVWLRSTCRAAYPDAFRYLDDAEIRRACCHSGSSRGTSEGRGIFP